MSELSITKAFELLKKLMKTSSGSDVELSKADVEKLMEEADVNGDSILTSEEFQQYYKENENYQELEEDYINAFEIIAGQKSEEGEIQGLTLEDVEAANKKVAEEKETEENKEPESPEGSSGSSGGGGGSYGGGTTPTVNGNSDGNLDPTSLSEKYNMNDLNSKRGEALSTLDKQREAKEAAVADAEAKTNEAQEKYNEAMSNLVDTIKAQEEEMTDLEKEIIDTEEIQSELNTEISNQEGIVSDCNEQVNTCSTNVSNISSELNSLVAPPETITVTDEEGNTTSIPNPAYAEYLAQKAALEAELAAAEEELAAAEVELADAEEELTNLEADLSNIEQQLQQQANNYLKTEVQNNKELEILQKDITDRTTEYNTAKQEEATIEQPFNAEIQKAQSDLRAYDQAMKIEKMPTDWSKEEKAGLEEVSKENLPAGYEAKSDGKIYDTEGNVVGKVAQPEEGSEEEPRYYLAKEAEKADLPFSTICAYAQLLADGIKKEDGTIDFEEAWKNNDLGQYSDKTLARIAEQYDKQMAGNQTDNKTDGPPATYLEGAAKYLYDEKNPSEYQAVVSALVSESARNEKAGEILTKEIDRALTIGDTKLIDTMIATAENNYKEFMQFIDNTGLPATIQTKLGANADKTLAALYEKVDQQRSTDHKEYGMTDERKDELTKQISGKGAKESLQTVMSLLDKGEITTPEASYLLGTIGNSEAVISAAKEAGMSAEQINNIFKISTTKNVETAKKIEKDPELEQFIKEKGLDPIKSKASDLDAALKEYDAKVKAEEKAEKEAEAQKPEQMIKDYLGENIKDELKELSKNPDELKTEINNILDEIMKDSNLSAQDKMTMMQELNKYSSDITNCIKEKMSSNDEFLTNSLSEIENIDEKMKFLEDYIALEGGVNLFNGDEEQVKATIDELSEILNSATPEQMEKLKQYAIPQTIASAVNNIESGSDKNTKLSDMLTSVAGSDKLSKEAKDYGLTEEVAKSALEQYGNKSVDEVITAVQKGEITNDIAKFVLANISNGDPQTLINNTKSENIKSLFEVYSPTIKVETTPQTRVEDLSETNTTPELTKEEFLASLDDPQAKKWFEQMFNELGYDYDKFWNTSNIPRDFQSLYSEAFATGTIRSAGCGITSLSMLSEWLTGEYKAPNELTRGYTGSNPASALEKNLNEMYPNYTRLFGQQALDNLDASLEAGKPVIANVRASSIFTDAGHFIVIAGKTADGKYIVNDPNIESYLKPDMVDGFMNGFTREQIEQGLSHIYFF